MTAPQGTRAPDRPVESLVRRLGAWDAALITIGSVIGTGIFLTTGDMASWQTLLPALGGLLVRQVVTPAV